MSVVWDRLSGNNDYEMKACIFVEATMAEIQGQARRWQAAAKLAE